MKKATLKPRKSAIVPVTYSSRREVVDGEHRLYPSRLSLMVFDAACYLAEQSGVISIVIAGEQSHRDHEDTTGDLLHRHIQHHHDFEVRVIRNEKNRLLNTPHQVDALNDEFSPEDSVVLVCWRFHEKRLRQGFESQKDSPKVEFIHAEDIIDDVWNRGDLWESEAQRSTVFRERYGLVVDWPEVKEVGLKDFEEREKITRIAMKFGKNGWLIKLLTRLRGTGRYDDINESAEPIMSTTS